MKVSGGGGAPLAILRPRRELRRLVVAGARLLASVEVVIAPDLVLSACLDEGLRDRPWSALVGYMQRSVTAVKGADAALVPLGPTKIRQHVAPGPAVASELRPFVIVEGVAAHIEHGVYGARAAERPAPRLVAPALVQPRLRHALERPIANLRPAGQQRDDADRHAMDKAPAFAARLDQADRDVGVFAEARRKHRAGGAAAGNHIVECQVFLRSAPRPAGQGNRKAHAVVKAIRGRRGGFARPHNQDARRLRAHTA